jgi:SAM-dependent methyltransferase
VFRRIGAGRVAIPLKRVLRPGDDLIGIDVDRVNVDWMRDSVPDIPVQLTDIYPPLPFPDASFDAIYGISVMTHLTQAAQQVWLRELRRVLRPGGICVLTTHGEFTLLGIPLTTDLVHDIIRHGIHDSMRDQAIELAEPGFYRLAFQLRAQVFDRWAPTMTILAYLPCVTLSQDWVVLRRD